MERRWKLVVERHERGYVAYPLGVMDAVVGLGETREEAIADAVTAIRVHLATFGPDAIGDHADILDAFIAEAVTSG